MSNESLGSESLGSRPLPLAANQGLGAVTVRFGAFLDFSYEIAEELADLVSCWAHLAAPIAARQTGLRELGQLFASDETGGSSGEKLTERDGSA